jgi:hypothetical protein
MGEVKEILLGLGVYCYLFAIAASPWFLEFLWGLVRKTRRLAPPKPRHFVLDGRRVGSWQR